MLTSTDVFIFLFFWKFGVQRMLSLTDILQKGLLSLPPRRKQLSQHSPFSGLLGLRLFFKGTHSAMGLR